MIRPLLPYLYVALISVALRDLSVYCAARIFCWRKRRQSQREAQQNRELRRLAAELAAAEKAEEEQKKKARIAKLMASVPYPRLLSGPRVITVRGDKDFLLVTRCLHANFVAQGKSIVDANFEEN